MLVNVRCKRPAKVKNDVTGILEQADPVIMWEQFVNMFPLSSELQERSADVDVKNRLTIYTRMTRLDVKEGDILAKISNGVETGDGYWKVRSVKSLLTAIAFEVERIDE